MGELKSEKRLRCFSSAFLLEVKRVCKIIFGSNLHKVEINTEDEKFDVYVWGSDIISKEIQERFNEEMQRCRIIPIQRIGTPNSDKDMMNPKAPIKKK